MSYCVGIDLGTTYSCVYVYDLINNNIMPIKFNNNNTIPTVIKIDNSNIKIGYDAKNIIDNKTYYNLKRFIGKTYNECIADLKFCTFEYTNESNKLLINYKDTYVTPEYILTDFLKKVKEISESSLKCILKKCVITVPAYFNSLQRQIIKQIGIDSGFDVLNIMSEPCAAAQAYKLNNNSYNKLLVFDFGGGTLDISILDVTKSGLVVINTSGDNHLGGEDINNLLIKKCISYFVTKNNICDIQKIKNICNDKKLIKLLREHCENAKVLLTKNYGLNINIDNFYDLLPLNMHLSYDEFIELITPILNKCINLIDKSLIINNQNIKKSITDVILIGGSTKLQAIKDIFNKWDNVTIHYDINPDESVAYGACLYCKNIIDLTESLLIDVTSHSLGIEVKNGLFEVIIPKNTIKPCKFTKIFSTATDNQRSFILNIYEGENHIANKNVLIDKIVYDNLPAKKAGEIKYEITFTVDENNIFTPSVKQICSDLGLEKD